MNRNMLVWSVMLSAILSLIAGCKSEHEEAIRNAYMAHMRAIQLNDGATVVRHTSASEFEYFKGCLELARSGTADEVQAASLREKSTIARMRHRLTPEQLQTMDAVTYVKHSIDQGWLAGGADPRSDDLKKIRVSPKGTSAIAEFEFNSRYNGTYSFELVDGVWTIDTNGLNNAFDEYYREMADELGISPEEVIIQKLEEKSGKKVRKDIWTRPY